ncbi:MAG: hypothetical protein ACTSUE_19685 [Promethearchaeota archaeon]
MIIKADPKRLSQLFANLLSTANKNTPPGGTITMSTKKEGNSVINSDKIPESD